MKAIGIKEYGGPENIVELDATKPQINDDQVLVETKAVGINPFDWKIATGSVKAWLKLKLPIIMDSDFAGVVVAVGANVQEFAAGDRVVGFTLTGASAEYIAADPKKMALLPDNVDFTTAAGVPEASMTIWQGIFNHAHVQPNEKVLIQGGAGGLGTFGIQILHQIGAKVYTTASAKNADLLKSLGADEVIDYHTTKITDVLSDMDVVFDTIGGDTVAEDFEVLKPYGRLVSVLGAQPNELAKEKHLRVMDESADFNHLDLQPMVDSIALGKTKVVIDKTFPFSVDGVREAIETSQSHHAVGKLIVDFSK
ncbi:NADP-dependent oxidoreductase [Fructilactobacillus sp. Tb1]|uniref:NADP-dependent oxidoreductase n=1 Tax=Fructilactobacillus sp. Tb1 TaxID=3422304 RepID=UPI003D290AC2